MIENYRPIASLSKLSLCFERLLYSQLYNIIEPQLSNKQHGFRKKHSTAGQLLIHFIIFFEARDNGDEMFTLYLAFCKAFDRVNFNLLITKLRSFGIDGCLLKLIYSYLTSRKQRVIFNRSPSSHQSIESRVPQGSLDGPLLFLVFVDDFPNKLFTSECLLYADDAKISIVNPLLLQNNKLSIHTRAEKNKMNFNLDKTILIWFTRKNNLEAQPILVFGGN